MDRHQVHCSQKTRKWIDKHAPNIRLIFMAAYSPDLNPDKMLSQDVKSNAVRKRRPLTLQDMTDNVRSDVRSRQRRTGMGSRV